MVECLLLARQQRELCRHCSGRQSTYFPQHSKAQVQSKLQVLTLRLFFFLHGPLYVVNRRSAVAWQTATPLFWSGSRARRRKITSCISNCLNLTFMEPCIARRIFYITNEMQLIQCSSLLSALYMFRAVFPPIIRIL